MKTRDTARHAARGSPRAEALPARRTITPPTPAHAASMRRHPSSNRAEDGPTCNRCGFRTPDRTDIPCEIAAIASKWRPVLPTAPPSQLEGAARLRDELHVVANRISRLRAAPGSPVLATLSIDAPTALRRTASVEHLLVMLDISAQRLADLAASLDAAEWDLRGRIGASDVSVAELALMPLHRSHARLTMEDACR